jgi:hypothetical protein
VVKERSLVASNTSSTSHAAKHFSIAALQQPDSEICIEKIVVSWFDNFIGKTVQKKL